MKELLAMEAGYRESTESWAEVLRNLRDRGLSPPLLAVGDGALGLWAALGRVFPVTEHQRCWNHRVLNVQSKLPKRLQAEAERAPAGDGRVGDASPLRGAARRLCGRVAFLGSESGGGNSAPGLGRLRRLLPLSQRTLGASTNQQPH